jgi:hypothetical protein
MAGDVAGMFKQLNQAVNNNPAATGAGQAAIDSMSQAFGNVAAPVAGMMQPKGMEEPSAYSFMNEGAKDAQGKTDLAKVNLDTPEGLDQAAGVYTQMGDTEKAMKMTTAANAQRETQLEKADEAADVLKTQKANEGGMEYALSTNDLAGARAIESGTISGADYYKMRLENSMKMKADKAGQDPYRGAFTKDVMMSGKMVPVRYAANGEPIAILGEGRRDVELKSLYNPATGGTQMAVVDKQNPSNIQFVGTGEKPPPTYEITKVGDKFHTWMTPPGGQPVRVAITADITKAEESMIDAKEQVKSVNLISSIDQAIRTLRDPEQNVGGMYGPLQWAPWASDQRTYEATIDSIRANIGFGALRELKESGGTLGQVSNIENMLLQSQITKLDTWTGKADQIKSLQKIRELTERIQVARTTDNPETLFTAEIDEATGVPTGNRLYYVDSETTAIIHDDGSVTMDIAGAPE